MIDAFILTKEIMWWIIRFLFFVVVFIVLVFLIPNYERSNLDVHEAQNFIFKEKLLNCFNFDDKLHNVDLNKFTKDYLENCVSYPKSIGARLTLTDLNNTQMGEIDFNEGIVRSIPFCEKGSFKCNTYFDYILLKDKSGAILKTEVINEI